MILLPSCKKDSKEVARESIEKAVAEMTFPRKIQGGEITGVTFADNMLIVKSEIAPDTLALLKRDDLEKRTLNNLRLNMGKLTAKLIEADANLRFIYYSGPDTIKFTFTPFDLK